MTLKCPSASCDSTVSCSASVEVGEEKGSLWPQLQLSGHRCSDTKYLQSSGPEGVAFVGRCIVAAL